MRYKINKKILKLQKNHEKKRLSKNKDKDDKSKEWHERLDEVGFILSKKFSYSKLSAAVDGKGGYEVHGFMQNQFFDYEKLFRDNVIDRACWFSKKSYEPEMIKLVDIGILENWYRSIHELESPYTFAHYPNFQFTKYIVYSKKPYKEAVKQLHNYPFSIKGYRTFVTLEPYNVGLLGWASWDLPIFIILHAVGKNEAFYRITTEAKEIDRETKAILNKVIQSQRSFIDTSNDKIDTLEEFAARYKKMYDDLKNDMLSNAPMMEAAEFAKFERSYMKKQNSFKRHLNWKSIAIWSVVLVVAAIVVLVSLRTTFSTQLLNSTIGG